MIGRQPAAREIYSEPIRADDIRPYGHSRKINRNEVIRMSDKKIEIFIPKGLAGEEPNLFVGVNGRSFLLPKGRKSLVPKCVFDEIERARRAEESAEARSAKLSALQK